MIPTAIRPIGFGLDVSCGDCALSWRRTTAAYYFRSLNGPVCLCRPCAQSRGLIAR